MKFNRIVLLTLSTLFCLLLTPAHALQRQMEYLDRGLVAVQTASGVFVSWRYLATDDSKVGFNIYRDGKYKVNFTPLTSTTNTLDTQGNTYFTYRYRIERCGSRYLRIRNSMGKHI